MAEFTKEDFHEWWSDASTWVQLSYAQTEKLRKTFFRVLSKMSPDDRETFLQEAPHVICSDDRGMTVCFWRPPGLPQPMPFGVIVLRHDLVRRAEFINTVAHETAHIVLGHHKKGDAIDLGYEEEKGADDRSESWGFNRCYSKARLNKLKVSQ